MDKKSIWVNAFAIPNQSLGSNLTHHLDYISSQMTLLSETDYFKAAVEFFIKQTSKGE
jgi:hypothetical protein